MSEVEKEVVTGYVTVLAGMALLIAGIWIIFSKIFPSTKKSIPVVNPRLDDDWFKSHMLHHAEFNSPEIAGRMIVDAYYQIFLEEEKRRVDQELIRLENLYRFRYSVRRPVKRTVIRRRKMLQGKHKSLTR